MLAWAAADVPWRGLMWIASACAAAGGAIVAFGVRDGPYVSVSAPFDARAIGHVLRNRGARLATLAIQVASELGFELRDAATGGASDANTTSGAGVPSLDGLGPIGGDDHGPNEWLDLSSVVPRISLLAGILSRLDTH